MTRFKPLALVLLALTALVACGTLLSGPPGHGPVEDTLNTGATVAVATGTPQGVVVAAILGAAGAAFTTIKTALRIYDKRKAAPAK